MQVQRQRQAWYTLVFVCRCPLRFPRDRVGWRSALIAPPGCRVASWLCTPKSVLYACSAVPDAARSQPFYTPTCRNQDILPREILDTHNLGLCELSAIITLCGQDVTGHVGPMYRLPSQVQEQTLPVAPHYQVTRAPPIDTRIACILHLPMSGRLSQSVSSDTRYRFFALDAQGAQYRPSCTSTSGRGRRSAGRYARR